MNESPSRSIGRTVVAILVLLLAAWVLFGFVAHVVSILFSTVILVIAVVAVLWALKILL